MPEMINAVLVHVHTTNDDKDKEITFEFAIMEGGKNLGSVKVGDGEVWDNGDQRDIRVPLHSPYPFSDRLRLSLAHIYSSSHGNPGWEGRVSARAELSGGNFRPVLNDTGNYKLGENNNPHRRDFPFNV